jgi:phosphoribosylamine--glycine ligase
MKLLIVGSGGREHALVWKIKQNIDVEKIYAAPGNAGMRELAECIDIRVDDITGLANFAKEKEIDLTVVGPEAPLVAGIVDEFDKAGLAVFGPSKAAAQLEGSKVFAKEFMAKHNIPTAKFKVFDNSQEAKNYITTFNLAPIVIKADGLAAGKGVSVAKTTQEAIEAIETIMDKKAFGPAGDRIVVEECLEGEEVSMLAICDGEDFVILESSQDHKRIFDEDKGPNTGGMGAYSPAPVINEEILKDIEDNIFKRTITGMLVDENRFKGVLYAGLMITKDGPKVLEYNVRFGDPETQAILPRLTTDLVELMQKAIAGKLKEMKLSWDARSCVCVILASGGYPGKYEKGKVISGLDDIKSLNDVFVFHAGTVLRDKNIVTSGGRVLGVTALGSDIKAAIESVYESINKIKFDNMHYRRDIAAKALKKVESRAQNGQRSG